MPVYNITVPPKVARRMKSWSLDRIADLQQWTGAEEEEETPDHSIVIAQDLTIAEFIKALGDAEKLPCKFALKVLFPCFSFDSGFRMATFSSMSCPPTLTVARS